MTFLPVLYSTWTIFAVLLLTLLVYRSTLTRYEDEKLFLDGHDEDGEKTQTEIIRKVTKMQPVVTFIGTATCVMSMAILGIYLYQAILVLRS